MQLQRSLVDFDFHAFSLSGFDVTVSKKMAAPIKDQRSSIKSIDECTRCVICRILPSSRLMKAISGVLESSRQSLSIGSTCSFIGRLFENHSGQKGG